MKKSLVFLIAILSTACVYAGQESDCDAAYVYPVISVGSEIDKSRIDVILEQALTSWGYMFESGNFVLESRNCFVKAIWDGDVLRVIPYMNSRNTYTAVDFAEDLIPLLRSEIDSINLSTQAVVSEAV